MLCKDIPDDWSSEQALVIVEFLDDLRNHICDKYQLQLRESPIVERHSDVDDPFDQAGWDDDVPF